MKIVHVLSDGTVKDDIKGCVVAPEYGANLYKILADINKR